MLRNLYTSQVYQNTTHTGIVARKLCAHYRIVKINNKTSLIETESSNQEENQQEEKGFVRRFFSGESFKGNYQVIKVKTPLSELDRYCTSLLSITQ